MLIQTDSGPNITHINAVGNGLVAVSTRRPDHIEIGVYCPLDSPTTHLYTFDSPFDGNLRNEYSKIFSRENRMLFVSKNNLFDFDVTYTVSSDDEVAVPTVHTFTYSPTGQRSGYDLL